MIDVTIPRRPLAARALRTGTVLVALTTALAGAASAQTVAEPALKAAFLSNFVKFTDWPADALAPGAPLLICSTDDAVTDALEPLVGGKTLGDHQLAAIRVQPGFDVRTCAVLYLGALESKRAQQWLGDARTASVLTIGDSSDALEAGAAMRFLREDGKIRFAVNLRAVAHARLTLSSKLLSLAKIVKD